MSWNNAQVTKGGVITDDFNPNTMESKLVNGLYATGEVLDIPTTTPTANYIHRSHRLYQVLRLLRFGTSCQ